MSLLAELDKASRAMKDAEIRLRTVETSLFAVDKEIYKLENSVNILNDNLKVLKKNNIIAIASEFKKIKETLDANKKRLNTLQADRDKIAKVYSNIEEILKKSQTHYEKLKFQKDNNLVRGNFGRSKNGQK